DRRRRDRLRSAAPQPGVVAGAFGGVRLTDPRRLETALMDVGALGMGFEEIYRAHFRFVWRSLRRLGVEERNVADAAQEVFLVVHRKLPGFEGRAKMTTWLFGICLRVAQARARRAHERREVLDDRVLLDAVSEEGDAAVQIEKREALAIVEVLL